MYRRLVLFAAAVAIFLVSAPLFAQQAVLAQMYGSGVHAYFSHDYREAHDYLNSAIGAGNQDPRCYYFRGLSYLKLGREEEAELDFQTGGELEAKDINQTVNVGRSLERIQGHDRLLVEKHRAVARMVVLQQEEKRRQERFGTIRDDEDRVLDNQPATLPDESQDLLSPPTEETDVFEENLGGLDESIDEPFSEPVDDAAALPGVEDPFAEDAAAPPAADDPFEEDAAAPPAADDPFEEDAAVPPAADDPFEDDAAVPPAADDPFEDDTAAPPGVDDPFEDDAAAPPAADDPFEDDAAVPPAADDPFEDDAAAPPAADDPFEDDDAAAPPAADDPFEDDDAAVPPAADDPFEDDAAADDPFEDDAAAPPAADGPFEEEPASGEPAEEPDEESESPFDDDPF